MILNSPAIKFKPRRVSSVEDSGSEQSQSLSRRLNRLSYGSIRGWNLIRVCVCARACVWVSIVHQQMTLAALVTHKLYSSHRPQRGVRSGVKSGQRQTRWCNRDDRVRSTHTESPSARVKTLQGQTSAHRYEDLV